MGVNIVAVVATVFAIVSGVFASLLLTTNQFVEVFVQEPNDELSCKIGFLGVYTAGFDANCLEENTLIESGLGGKSDVTGELSQTIEPFESDTLDFKLLFVAQTDFYTEFSVLETLGLGAAPEFENCEQYVGELAQEPANYVAAAAGITQGVFGAFVDGLTSQVFSNTFADADGVSQLLAGLTQTVGSVVAGAMVNAPFNVPADTLVGGASSFNVSSYLAIAAQISPSLAATPTIQTFVDNSIAQLQSGADDGSLDGLIGASDFPNGVTLDFVFNALYVLNFNIVQAVSADQVNSMCFAFAIGAPGGTCSLVDIATPAQTFVDEGVTLAAGEGQEAEDLAASLKQGWNGLQLFISIHADNAFGGLLGTADATIIDTATSVLEVVVAQRVSVDIGNLPATWTDVYTVCNLMNIALGLGVSAPCSLEKFILSSSAGEVSAAADLSSFVLGSSIAALVANNLAPDQLGAIESFSGLFDSCFNLNLGGALAAGLNVVGTLTTARASSPASCYGLFPNIIIATQYQDSDLFTEADFFAAVEKKCDDDTLDQEAIATAQTLGPIGNALVFVGALAGIIAVVKPNKIVTIVAAVLVLAGVGFLLGALLVVYDAPVYQAVGQEAEDFEVIYAGGVTITYGLVSMGLGAVSSVAFVASLFLCNGDNGNVLESDMKPASL